MPEQALYEAVAVTAELTGTELSKVAARVFVQDLDGYPLTQVLGALERCRREVRWKLTLADVINRLDDGRPSAEEAWAMVPKDEQTSVIWNDEIAEAWGIASSLTDTVAARMAFKEAYNRIVSTNRNAKIEPRWWPSFGFDPDGRKVAVREAVDRRRITGERAAKMLPGHPAPSAAPLLERPVKVGELLEAFSK